MHHHSIAVWVAVFTGMAVAMGGAIVAVIVSVREDKKKPDA